jgi:hypothetical protein
MGHHLYTVDATECQGALQHDFRWQGIQCYVYPPAPPPAGQGSTPFFRLANRDSGDHFYTINPAGRDGAASHGYTYEGIACYVFGNAQPGTVPLFRLWSGDNADHMYTTDAAEVTRLTNDSYSAEGTEGNVSPIQAAGMVPLFRVYNPEESWWDDAVNTVSDAISSGANAIGDALSDAAETIGNAIGDAADALAGALSEIPWIGEVLGGIVHWLGNVASSSMDFGGSLVKGVLNIAGGELGGLIKIVGGLLGLDSGLIGDGFGEIISSFVGSAIGMVLKAGALLNNIVGGNWNKRALTRAEKDMLRKVFRDSVALYNVRVVDGYAGIFNASSSPYTIGDTIYMRDTALAEYQHSLVHECTHVWQYQNLGYNYIADSIFARAQDKDAYDWEAELQHGRDRWQDFNAEAEAAFVEDVWENGRLAGAMGNGVFYTDDPIGNDASFTHAGNDFTPFARASIAYIRGYKPPRLSGGI